MVAAKEKTYVPCQRLAQASRSPSRQHRSAATSSRDIYNYDGADGEISKPHYGASEKNRCFGSTSSRCKSLTAPQVNDSHVRQSHQGYQFWDFDNRMASATVPVGATEGIEGTHTYTYDALGRRVGRLEDGIETVSVSMLEPVGNRPVDQTLTEYNSGAIATNPNKQYTYGTYVDDVVTSVTPTASRYFHASIMHNTSVITDAGGNALERYAYSPYGRPVVLDADGQTVLTASAIGTSLLFMGRPFDVVTGLYYFRARYLASALGRFISRDPSGYVNGADLYAFVIGNPLRYTDPTGEMAWAIPAAFINPIVIVGGAVVVVIVIIWLVKDPPPITLPKIPRIRWPWPKPDPEPVRVDPPLPIDWPVDVDDGSKKGTCNCFSGGTPGSPDWGCKYTYGSCTNTAECNSKCESKGYSFGICSFG